jgi:ribonuclease D
VNRLRPRQRSVAYALADWRETTAASENRPVGSILSDVALIEVARRQPETMDALTAIRGVRPDVGRRRGAAIIDVIRHGRELEPPPVEDHPRPEPDPGDSARIALCESVVRQRVGEAGLAYELVASRADLTELLDLLAGRRAVRATRGGVTVDPVTD